MLSLESRSFVDKAEDRLAGVRGSLLLFAQGHLSTPEIVAACRRLAEFRLEAENAGFIDIGRLAAEAAYAVEQVAPLEPEKRSGPVNAALDLLSQLEAEVLGMPVDSDEFRDDAGLLIDSAFETLVGAHPSDGGPIEEAFEIDDETLEIFREEADALIANITAGVQALRDAPQGSNAVWEIRRNVHTYKGAAGIVGLVEASKVAHSVEDMLDEMVRSARVADDASISFLLSASERLGRLANGIKDKPKSAPASPKPTFETSIESKPYNARSGSNYVPPTPVVRVSLDRLDELLAASASLIADARELAAVLENIPASAEVRELLLKHDALAHSIQDGLQHIRMVRFGVLDMRLNRAVNITCQDEGKKADVIIDDPEVEIDTLVIDALIEPLLHLLKNAVVHGIERPETRRLLGKPETGTIRIKVAADPNTVLISIEDDGQGISGANLISQAVKAGIIEAASRDSLADHEAFALIFERGLTTAESINMNAGRGVGMSIVKESVEARGGSIAIMSEPQQGTKFTLTFPTRSASDLVGKLAISENTPGPLILVVDDSLSIRRVTSLLVESVGCRVITAGDGAEALGLLRSNPTKPDLILSDVEMPVMDGWQFLEGVKGDADLGHIPVVMVTSLSEDVHQERAALLGATDYLVKPLELKELERILGDVLQVVT